MSESRNFNSLFKFLFNCIPNINPNQQLDMSDSSNSTRDRLKAELDRYKAEFDLFRQKYDGKSESTNWLSSIIQTLWPSVEEYAPEVFKDFVGPAINANMPGIFPPIFFTKVTIGKTPPKMKSMRVLPMNPGRPDMISLEAEMEYAGDVDVEISLGSEDSPMKVGISEVTCSGTIELLIGPRIKKIPFFEASQVGFITPPKIDYKLNGIAAVANFELFKQTFRQVGDQIFNDMFALPARTTFPTFPKIDFFNTTTDHLGVFRISVVSGKGFPNSDALNGKPDVYIRLQHCGIKKKTGIINNSNDPVFKDEVIDFAICSTSDRQYIHFQALDYDFSSADDKIGEAQLTLIDLTKKSTTEIKLKDKKFGSKPRLTVKAKRLPISFGQSDITEAIQLMGSENNNRKNCSRLLLKLNIEECLNLPECRAPFVKFKVGKKIKSETGSAFHGKLGDAEFDASHPVYFMSYTTFIEEPITQESTIEFSVHDRLTGKRLGSCSAFLTAKNLPSEFVLQECTRNDSILKANIRLAAVLDAEPFWNSS